MTLYDSSVLIEYLDGSEAAVSYVDAHLGERAVAPQLVLFEIYQGEVFKSGPADFDAVDDALRWVTPIDDAAGFARAGAALQQELLDAGTPLSARDAFIAGAAHKLGEPLVVADVDFDAVKSLGTIEVDVLTSEDSM